LKDALKKEEPQKPEGAADTGDPAEKKPGEGLPFGDPADDVPKEAAGIPAFIQRATSREDADARWGKVEHLLPKNNEKGPQGLREDLRRHAEEVRGCVMRVVSISIPRFRWHRRVDIKLNKITVFSGGEPWEVPGSSTPPGRPGRRGRHHDPAGAKAAEIASGPRRDRRPPPDHPFREQEGRDHERAGVGAAEGPQAYLLAPGHRPVQPGGAGPGRSAPNSARCSWTPSRRR
jgi:hypothetical protein